MGSTMVWATAVFVSGGRSLYPSATTPIKHEGIRLGAVTGWRIWIVGNDLTLRSVTVDVWWQPGEVMNGDVSAYGVYAFKTREQNYTEHLITAGQIVVLGTVAMWGEIVEHEDGYRAEHARITSLVEVGGADSLRDANIILNSLQIKYDMPRCRQDTQNLMPYIYLGGVDFTRGLRRNFPVFIPNPLFRYVFGITTAMSIISIGLIAMRVLL